MASRRKVPVAKARSKRMPYPKDSHIEMYKDDGKWTPGVARSEDEMKDLYVDFCILSTNKNGAVDITRKDWAEVCKVLREDYPGCIFFYA